MKSPPPWQHEKRRLGILRQKEVPDTPSKDIVIHFIVSVAPICPASTLPVLLADKKQQRYQPSLWTNHRTARATCSRIKNSNDISRRLAGRCFPSHATFSFGGQTVVEELKHEAHRNSRIFPAPDA
jgi:hypothetical protein